MPYNPQTADQELGIPYTTVPETEVMPDGIERGTLSQVYENINRDIEEGLPLINDEVYSVPNTTSTNVLLTLLLPVSIFII